MSPRQQGRGGAGGKRVSALGRALFPSSTVSLSTLHYLGSYETEVLDSKAT